MYLLHFTEIKILWSDPIEKQLLFNVRNISEYLRLNAEKHPEKPALLYPEMVTYREMEKKVNQYSFWT